MNILHVTPSVYSDNSVIGGGEKYVLYLIRALNLLNEYRINTSVSQVVLSFGKTNSSIKRELFSEKIISGSPSTVSGIDISELKNIISDADIVIIHQCLTNFGLFMASHAKTLKKLVIGIDHGGGINELVHCTPLATKMFDLFWAQSEFASLDFKNCSVPTQIIRGPIDTDDYEFNGPREEKTIVSVGRILPHKGFETILNAIESEPYKVTIIGRKYDEAYYDYLLSLAQKKNLDLTIATNLDDYQVKNYVGSANVYIQASTHYDYRGRFYQKPELLGLASLEALSLGTPTLVSNAGALVELDHLNSCRTFSGPKELKKLLRDYFDRDPNSWSRSEIKKSVTEHYGLKQFAQHVIDGLIKLGVLK